MAGGGAVRADSKHGPICRVQHGTPPTVTAGRPPSTGHTSVTTKDKPDTEHQRRGQTWSGHAAESGAAWDAGERTPSLCDRRCARQQPPALSSRPGHVCLLRQRHRRAVTTVLSGGVPAGCNPIHSFLSVSLKEPCSRCRFLARQRLPPGTARHPRSLPQRPRHLTSSPFLSVFLPDQKRWAQVLTARPWSGFFRSLEAARAHCVLSGSWFSSPKHFILSNVPMISVMAASWALESLISSSYRENAWRTEQGAFRSQPCPRAIPTRPSQAFRRLRMSVCGWERQGAAKMLTSCSRKTGLSFCLTPASPTE